MHGSDIRLLDPLRASIGGPKALLGFWNIGRLAQPYNLLVFH